jgi:hypothetical protein
MHKILRGVFFNKLSRVILCFSLQKNFKFQDFKFQGIKPLKSEIWNLKSLFSVNLSQMYKPPR